MASEDLAHAHTECPSAHIGTFIPGGLGTSLEVCRDKIFAGKIVNMAVLREAS